MGTAMIRPARTALNEPVQLEAAEQDLQFGGRKTRSAEQLVEGQGLMAQQMEKLLTRRAGGGSGLVGGFELEPEELRHILCRLDEKGAFAQEPMGPGAARIAGGSGDGGNLATELEGPADGVHRAGSLTGLHHQDELREGRDQPIALQEVVPQWSHLCGELADHGAGALGERAEQIECIVRIGARKA